MIISSERSQQETFTKLEKVLWETDLPIILAMEPADAQNFLDGPVVEYLSKNRDAIKGTTCHSANLESETLPAIWQDSLNDENRAGQKRLLVIDRFEQILDKPFSEQQNLSKVLSEIAFQKNVSVLLFASPDSIDSFAWLGEDRPIENEQPSIDQDSLHRTREKANARLALILSTVIATILLAIAAIVRLPKTTDDNEILNLPGGEKLSAIPTAPILKLPAPSKVELTEDLKVMNSGEGTFLAFSQFLGRKVTQNGTHYRNEISSTLFSQIEQEIPEVGKNPSLANFTAESKPVTYLVKPPPLPEFKPIDESRLASFVTRKALPKPVALTKSQPPLTIPDLLGVIDSSKIDSVSDLNNALDNLLRQYPERDSGKLWDWFLKLNSQKKHFELRMAETFAEQNDLASTFHWYQKHADRTSLPDAIGTVGAAQMFGRGTPVNYSEALKNLLRAWEGGDADSAYLYGIAQLQGLGTAKNAEKAYRTFNTAIEMGSKLAYREAGRMQELGLGEPQNLYWAVHRYEQGANLGDPYCIWRLIQILETDENRLFPVDSERAGLWRKTWKTARLEPMHFHVTNIMPDDFYNKRVLRRG